MLEDPPDSPSGDHIILQRAEAEEVDRLLSEVRSTPKGAKKDISRAAAKAYNPRIVEAAW
jgi:hypothetical protein